MFHDLGTSDHRPCPMSPVIRSCGFQPILPHPDLQTLIISPCLNQPLFLLSTPFLNGPTKAVKFLFTLQMKCLEAYSDNFPPTESIPPPLCSASIFVHASPASSNTVNPICLHFYPPQLDRKVLYPSCLAISFSSMKICEIRVINLF